MSFILTKEDCRTSIHDEPSFFDEQHAVERFDPLKMVRDHNDRFLCENAHDGVEHLLFGNGIEPDRWFIEHYDG